MSELVLSTMAFDAAWLAEVASVSKEIELRQVPSQDASALPAELVRRAAVLYTSAALPDPRQAPNLRWVQLDTSGADHVRGTPLWAAQDVAITSLGGVSQRPMAEYVIAMVLAHAHRLPEILADRPARRWPGAEERWARYGPRQLLGARMVILGYGRLGRAIGQLAGELGMEVVGVRRGGSREYDGGHPRASIVATDRLAEAVTGADVLVVSVPGTPETTGLVDAGVLARLAPGAAVVNVSRGGVVDEPALLAALAGDHVSWAALDVFAEEPLPDDSVWWTHPKVWPTPHVSGLAPDYADQVRELFKANLERFLAHEPLLNVVDRRLGY